MLDGRGDLVRTLALMKKGLRLRAWWRTRRPPVRTLALMKKGLRPGKRELIQPPLLFGLLP